MLLQRLSIDQLDAWAFNEEGWARSQGEVLLHTIHSVTVIALLGYVQRVLLRTTNHSIAVGVIILLLPIAAILIVSIADWLVAQTGHLVLKNRQSRS